MRGGVGVVEEMLMGERRVGDGEEEILVEWRRKYWWSGGGYVGEESRRRRFWRGSCGVEKRRYL